MDLLVMQGVELAIKSSITSSGRGCDIELNTPDRRDFLKNVEDIPVMTVSILLNLNDDNDEAQLIVTFRVLIFRSWNQLWPANAPS